MKDKHPSEYQVVARKYRPQTFSEILGQDPLVTTLKNAIRFKRLAHAYLFSGSRGTGKTTTARIFAKALNCNHRSEDCEPCNSCTSCKEITGGHSLDVLEIDGASHRGIEDIRQINNSAGYATPSGGYKVYIIDEVHMLTKEAFNALLKTLEEPPEKVLFLFATTEPHKVLPTILSRCQRFQLNRISNQVIVDKLQSIAQDMKIEVDEEALQMISGLSDGGLRDAESLFDQVVAFHGSPITAHDVASVLGITPKDLLFELDEAGKEGNMAKAFEIVHHLYTGGKDMHYFLSSLIEHFRNILLLKTSGKETPSLYLTDRELAEYEKTSALYNQEQCLTILDLLLESEQTIRFSPSAKTALEAILMRIIRIHNRIPIEFLVRRLNELEKNVHVAPQPTHNNRQLTEDPTPELQEIPLKPKTAKKKPPSPKKAPSQPKTVHTERSMEKNEAQKHQSRYDTLFQFAAIELEGQLERNH